MPPSTIPPVVLQRSVQAERDPITRQGYLFSAILHGEPPCGGWRLPIACEKLLNANESDDDFSGTFGIVLADVTD
jgi:hypothetical protein